MLNRYFSKLDPDSKLSKALQHFKQARFNIKWLKAQKLIFGKLQCAYCGCNCHMEGAAKGKTKANRATVDHFVPKVKGGGHFDTDNFVVSCNQCNNKKGALIWPISKLKFYYGPLNGTLTFVPEIKWSINFFIPFGFSIFAPQLYNE